MKTTLDIDDTLIRELREAAVRRGTTMSALVEAGLRKVLNDAPHPNAKPKALPPLPVWHGGAALVDVADRDGLCRAMEEERVARGSLRS